LPTIPLLILIMIALQVWGKPLSGNVIWAVGSLILIRMLMLYSEVKAQRGHTEELLAGKVTPVTDTCHTCDM
jgi:hypothetical protein